jgi:hypothetical protein
MRGVLSAKARIQSIISPMYHQVPIEQRITKTSLIKKWQMDLSFL